MTFFLFLRVFLASTMIAAGVLKIFSFTSFKSTVLALIPNKKINIAGTISIVLLEFLSGFLLFSDSYYDKGIYLVWVLILGYFWAVWKSSRLNSKVICNCFGDLVPETLGKSTLYRIAVLTIFNVLIMSKESYIIQCSLYEILLAILFCTSLIGIFALLKSFKDYYIIEKTGGNN